MAEGATPGNNAAATRQDPTRTPSLRRDRSPARPPACPPGSTRFPRVRDTSHELPGRDQAVPHPAVTWFEMRWPAAHPSASRSRGPAAAREPERSSRGPRSGSPVDAVRRSQDPPVTNRMARILENYPAPFVAWHYRRVHADLRSGDYGLYHPVPGGWRANAVHADVHLPTGYGVAELADRKSVV